MSPRPPRLFPDWDSDPPPSLPRGRHRPPFAAVAEDQHRRLLAGVGTALAEHDYAALTVKHVIEAAGVSRAAFDANFDSKRDAVLVAHRDAFERLLGAIVGACASEREWPLKARAAIAATFALLAEQPGSARLLTLSPVAAELTIGRQVRDSNARLAALLREGRDRTPHGPDLPELVEEGMIGGASALLARRLLDAGVEGLRSLEPEVLQILLTPYIGGPQAARLARTSGEAVEAPAVADRLPGGERLLARIAAACDPAADFTEQLRSALAAALALLAADPDLARLLCVEPCSQGDLPLGAGQGWRGRCGLLLRRAARSCPRASASPLFLEPLLIDGVCRQISDRLRTAGAGQLPDLLPDLLESILAYYLEPADLARVVAGARAGRGEDRG